MEAKYKNKNHHLWKGGTYLENGYVMKKAEGHPKANKRGYVAEHRLVVEKNIGRFLSADEVVHHINRVRSDNRIENLELKVDNSEHIKGHKTIRNPNGQIIASQPIFSEIKFRLYDSDRGITLIYTLSKLIGTTFRRGKFEFRGRWTGLKDKNGKEIYEGDIVRSEADDEDSAAGAVITITSEVCYGQHPKAHRVCDYLASFTLYSTGFYDEHAIFYGRRWTYEVIGNIYENPELLIPSNTSNK